MEGTWGHDICIFVNIRAIYTQTKREGAETEGK